MTTTTLAPIEVRENHDIFDIDGGWFQARWHFSFDQYYDPQNMNMGQLRVFNHDTLVPGAIWPMHPHRDVEGITRPASPEHRHGGRGTHLALRANEEARVSPGLYPPRVVDLVDVHIARYRLMCESTCRLSARR